MILMYSVLVSPPMMAEVVHSEPESHGQQEVRFRRYRLEDIPACAVIAEDAWPAGPAIASEAQELSNMKGYMRWAASVSNWTEVASISDTVVGFLFGRIDNYSEKESPKKSLLGETPSVIRSFFADRRVTLNHMRFIWNLALTELKVNLKMPSSDASIEMFIVDSKHRGKGIGRELVNRFLSTAKEAGSSLVTVYTDNRMSNWQFYERCGFRKVETFYDNITSHYFGEDSLGIIFTLDLKQIPSVPNPVHRI